MSLSNKCYITCIILSKTSWLNEVYISGKNVMVNNLSFTSLTANVNLGGCHFCFQ